MKRTLSFVLLAIILASTLVVSVQWAKGQHTLIVDPHGGEGIFVTIQGAVDNSAAGDTILVHSGNYPEDVTVNKNNLTIIGQYKHTAVVQGSFFLSYVSYVTIANFTILGSGSSDGIRFEQSSFNIIMDNNISNCDTGLYFNYMNPPPGSTNTTTCRNNTILENDIINCYKAVWFMEGLTYNRFYHNNFYSTTVDYAIPDVEFWDNGYPSGGNYWSSNVIVDAQWGPGQNKSGWDGINDTQYMVYDFGYGDLQGFDRYPLASPWVAPDIAVTSVAPSKTAIGEGTTIDINTTWQNNGSKVEEFSVFIYANTSVIGTFPNIMLLVGTGRGICSWNTTGFAKGNYTIRAYASPVQGETNLDDNTLIYGTVWVGVPGDVTGPVEGVPDGKVDMRDIGYVCTHFGKPPITILDYNCDINGDGRIDMRDIGITCTNFGKHI